MNQGKAMSIIIKVRETTCNDINTLSLIGSHPLKGDLELAVREHHRSSGSYNTRALVLVAPGIRAAKEFDLKDWPAAVRKAVKDWKESCHALEVENARYDQIGRELFASLATE